MKLNLGAGSTLIPGYVNVDRVRLPATQVVLDLNRCCWHPWLDDSIEAIEAAHIFEHVANPVTFMTECHRILEPGGRLHILTPHVASRDSWTDPTHVRHCTEDSFCFWIPGNVHYEHNNAAYGGVSFDLVALAVTGGVIDITLAKVPREDPLRELMG